MNYYNTFVSDFILRKLEFKEDYQEQEGGQTDLSNYYNPMSVRFYNAYPVSIGAIELGSRFFDTYTSFNVQFTYESYELTYNTGAGNNSGGSEF